MRVPGRDTVDGVDVSRWQGGINWDAFNLDFAILKATGGDGGLYKDGQFTNNARWPRPWGAYHFAGGGSPEAEATHFAHVIAGTGWTLPPTLDWEVTAQMGWAGRRAAEAVDWIHRFQGVIGDRFGVTPMLYTGAYVVGIQGGPQSLTRYPLWLAAYTNQPIPCGPWGANWTAWQYSSTGRVPGIAGNVDMNIMDRAYFESHGATPSRVQPPPGTPTPIPTTLEELAAMSTPVVADDHQVLITPSAEIVLLTEGGRQALLVSGAAQPYPGHATLKDDQGQPLGKGDEWVPLNDADHGAALAVIRKAIADGVRTF